MATVSPPRGTWVAAVACLLLAAGGCGRSRTNGPPPGPERGDLPPVTAPPTRTDPSAPPPIGPPTETRPRVNAQPGEQEPGGLPLPPRGSGWGRPLDEGELELLDVYRGFSADDRLYAFTEPPRPGSAPMLVLQDVTKPASPRTLSAVMLDSLRARRQAEQLLADGGFPRPGSTPAPPPTLQADLRGREVFLLLRGAPTGKQVRAFENVEADPLQASVVALSADGARAAVRVTGRREDGTWTVPEHHVFVLAPGP